MTGREFLNSLDDKHFSLAMVAMADAYPDIVARLLEREEIIEEFGNIKNGKDMRNAIIRLKASYTCTFLTKEVDKDFEELINGDIIAEG